MSLDSAREDALDHEPKEIADRADLVGRDRLDRSNLDILITAVIGGIEVSIGGLAAMLVVGAALAASPGLPLYAALALGGIVFPIGFVFVILGRSELFTENFLIPVVSVLNRERPLRTLVELFAFSWFGNLVGCAIIAALLLVPDAIGHPILDGYRDYAAFKLAVPLPGVFVSALLAGLVMTALTWALLAIHNTVADTFALFSGGYVLFGANLSHSIIGASIIFVGFAAAGRTLIDVAAWITVATIGNLVGGVGLVTLFRFVQAREQGKQT